jgi:sortase A
VTASRARPLRAVLRFLGAVLMTSGVLLLADAAITFAWQEPVSALLAQREQSRLADLLEEAERRAAADRRALANLQAARLLGALADRQERRTRKGDPIGRIELPTADRSWVVVEGTGTGELRKGPGHYPETQWPGQPGTVAPGARGGRPPPHDLPGAISHPRPAAPRRPHRRGDAIRALHL